MARPPRAWRTSMGFFDLAVAAPSMAAALRAWGATRNLFREGFASETTDPAIVAATRARPGVVLRRPVGTSEPFREDAAAPTRLPSLRTSARTPAKKPARKAAPAAGRDDARARRAADAALRRAERQARQREKREEREAERQERAIATARSALHEARARHDATIDALRREQDALDLRKRKEETRWTSRRRMLERALRRAGG